MKIRFIVLALCLGARVAVAGEDDWQVTKKNGDKVTQLTPVSLANDTLTASSYGIILRFPLDSVVEIRQIGHSKFWLGAALGCAGGAIIGGIIGNARAPQEGVNAVFAPLDVAGDIMVGTLLGFGIGGAIGSSSGGDQVYDLSQKEKEFKIEVVQKILSELDKDKKK